MYQRHQARCAAESCNSIMFNMSVKTKFRIVLCTSQLLSAHFPSDTVVTLWRSFNESKLCGLCKERKIFLFYK